MGFGYLLKDKYKWKFLLAFYAHLPDAFMFKQNYLFLPFIFLIKVFIIKTRSYCSFYTSYSECDVILINGFHKREDHNQLGLYKKAF